MEHLNDSYTPKPLVIEKDYYLDPRGFRIMTTRFLTERGYCCGNGCKHCPYFPKHQKGNTQLE